MDKRAKILVVEDENDINKLICSILENKGYRARAAFSGTEALMCVKNEKWQMILFASLLIQMI